MMKEKKTVFKFCTIPEYNKEEQYLSAMHREGWRLTAPKRGSVKISLAIIREQ